nr:DUF4097 family beta strand repeat-containing protein [Thermococcus zilligii]
MIFENVKEIEIKAVNGRLSIEGWGGEVEVDYTRHGEVEVEVEQSGERLIIEEKPRTRKVLGVFSKSPEGWAEINLKVPDVAIVSAKNVNGEIIAKGVRFGEVTTVNGQISLENCWAEKLSSVNGRIRAHLKVAGPLKASTVNGKVEITLDDLEGDVSISTVNGGVTLRLTEFCDARITAKAVNGGVHFAGIDPENPVIGTGNYEVRVSTVNGSVRVELV